MRKIVSARGNRLALAIASSPVLAAGLALAQGNTASNILEVVTATAQRRVQDLQDVPIAAAVLTGDMLEAKRTNTMITGGDTPSAPKVLVQARRGVRVRDRFWTQGHGARRHPEPVEPERFAYRKSGDAA